MLPRKSIWLPQLSKNIFNGEKTNMLSINVFNVTFHLVDKPVWREKALSAVDILTEAQELTVLRFRFSSQLHIKAILSNFGIHYCKAPPTKKENMHPFKKILSILMLHLKKN